MERLIFKGAMLLTILKQVLLKRFKYVLVLKISTDQFLTDKSSTALLAVAKTLEAVGGN